MMLSLITMPVFETPSELGRAVIFGPAGILLGYLLFRYADFVGEHVHGFTIRGQTVNPCPGWMLWPFGLLLFIGSLFMTGLALWQLLSN